MRFFFFGTILLPFFVQAQQNFSPKVYTAKDGLPNGYVLHVTQDHEGNLWIGTFSGLSRFDGNLFLNYGFQNGLTNLSIDEIYEEEDSTRIWLGSRNGIFFLRGDTIKQVAVEDSAAITFVFQIQKMSTGQLCALTDKGIYLLDNEHELKKIKIPTLEAKIFRKVVELDNNKILVTHGQEQSDVFSVNSNKEVKLLFPTIPNNRFIDIISVSEKEMIISTGLGLFRVNNKGAVKIFSKQLDGKFIYGCLYDRHGRLWVSTDSDGVLIADSVNADSFTAKIEIDEPVKMVSSFFEANDGAVWAGTSNTLLQINNINYRIYKQTDNPLIENVFKILKDKNGKLFFEGKSGLVNWEENSVTPVTIRTKSKNQNNLKGTLIESWCYDNDNNLWYMSRDGVFGRVVNGSMEEIVNRNEDGFSHVSLEFDSKRNKVWIPTNQLLLADANAVSAFQSANRESIESPTLVVVLSDGNVLVKTLENKLWRIDSKNQVDLIVSSDIDVSRIMDFKIDSWGNLWLLYLDGGLLKCTIEDNMLVSKLEVSMKSGMPSNAIESFTFDNENRIWIATHAGLSVVDWKAIETNDFPLIYQMDKILNLPIQNWTFANLLTDDDGNIRLTSVDQIFTFFVKKIDFNIAPPTAKFEKVLLDSKANVYDSLSDVQTSPITLKYDQNFLTFSFTGISLIDHTLLFSYKLVGATELWSTPSPNNVVSYGKLPSGDYEFLVKTRTRSSVWSEPAAFRFTITKPFWAQWYFISIIALALIVLAYWIHRLRLNQALKIERMRLRIAQDLHDEIGSTLSSVSYNIDSIQRRLNGSEAGVKKLLETINTTSSAAIRTLSDIVWAINPEKDNSMSLSKRMNQFALEICEAREIKLFYDEGLGFKNARLTVDVRKSFYLIFKEAVNNAVKHSKCTEIKVSLLSSPHVVEMVIADNGNGFDNTLETGGNGLKNIKERSGEIYGQLMITSKLGVGTTVSLKSII
ncbi:MAG: hypothetical protein IPJ20_12710 [Flammeovirgaceae bacterium]|nr:hypothetical protein [Flammeovirgaceae bacterium]